jgi:hypothetical protein
MYLAHRPLTFDDVDQLHHRITQTCEQYDILSQGCSIRVYYIRNTKDELNSFERFKLQIAGGTEPVESVLLKYDFLVILPTVRKPQRYSISVRVVSRLALERRMREEGPFFALPRFIKVMARHTAYCGLGIYAAYKLAWWSAKYAELAVDSWSTISYIQLNRGDDIEIANSTRANRNNLIKGACGVLGTVVVNIAATIIAAFVS